jgi:hypothetical protein
MESWGEMSDELDFQGARVRLKDDALNLTDMWKAAGAPGSKPPAEWQRQSQATEFIDFIADTMGRAHNLLLWTKTGRSGGTWAHWQIGMAYAKYLSPALHAWFNSIVRAHMERRTTGSFQHQVLERLDRIEHRVDTLDQRLPQRRREISKPARTRLVDAILALGGRCPCCGRAEVVDADGAVLEAEFDHFYSNQLPSEEHAWLICLGCHSDLTTGKLPRTKADAHFRSFQLRRTDLTTPADPAADGDASPGDGDTSPPT